MQLCRFFSSTDCQTSFEMQIIEQEKQKLKKENEDNSSSESSCDEEENLKLNELGKEEQLSLLKNISSSLLKSSRQFDIDI